MTNSCISGSLKILGFGSGEIQKCFLRKLLGLSNNKFYYCFVNSFICDTLCLFCMTRLVMSFQQLSKSLSCA